MESSQCQVALMIADRDGTETESCPRCRRAQLGAGGIAELKFGNHSAANLVNEHNGRQVLGNGNEFFSIAGEAFWGDGLFDR